MTALTPNNNIKFSNRKVEVYFEHLGREIILRLSVYSGKEEVFIDNQLISEKINWRFNSAHRFEFEGTTYEIQLQTIKTIKGILLGRTLINLIADNQLIDRDYIGYFDYYLTQYKQKKLNWKSLFHSFLPYFLVGAVLGVASALIIKLFFSA